eukprot:TRINITY_DN3476_c0_g1_i2.p1 TRINITY_DN3476_c0_g1~~TRINITY_DN3476_c0_g1_i2.p1  ORF type:complete len:226 (-),score=49.33 TRINITY_DN3476_c0_g1_i2:150-827(-)
MPKSKEVDNSHLQQQLPSESINLFKNIKELKATHKNPEEMKERHMRQKLDDRRSTNYLGSSSVEQKENKPWWSGGPMDNRKDIYKARSERYKREEDPLNHVNELKKVATGNASRKRPRYNDDQYNEYENPKKRAKHSKKKRKHKKREKRKRKKNRDVTLKQLRKERKEREAREQNRIKQITKPEQDHPHRRRNNRTSSRDRDRGSYRSRGNRGSSRSRSRRNDYN